MVAYDGSRKPAATYCRLLLFKNHKSETIENWNVNNCETWTRITFSGSIHSSFFLSFKLLECILFSIHTEIYISTINRNGLFCCAVTCGFITSVWSSHWMKFSRVNYCSRMRSKNYSSMEEWVGWVFLKNTFLGIYKIFWWLYLLKTLFSWFVFWLIVFIYRIQIFFLFLFLHWAKNSIM